MCIRVSIAENGATTRIEQYVHTGEDWSLIASEDYEYDDEQDVYKRQAGNHHGHARHGITPDSVYSPTFQTEPSLLLFQHQVFLMMNNTGTLVQIIGAVDVYKRQG